MFSYFKRFQFLGIVIVLNVLYGCATESSGSDAQKTQEAFLSRASYEQIRPAIEKIQVGDARSKVLEIVKPKKEQGRYFEEKQWGKTTKLLAFPNWPGVLTPFNTTGYVLNPEKLSVMHFGYLDGKFLRPRKIIVFDGDRVSKVIDVPDPTDLRKLPGAVVVETDPLAHFRKEAYEQVFLKKKDQIVLGMSIWEVFPLLGANYIMVDNAQAYVVICLSYLNYKRTEELEKTTEGVRAVYPFGYMEGDNEIVKWEVETLNKLVVRVRPHEG